MTTIDRTPLDGFEERLLAQLKTHIAARPMPDPRLEKHAATRRRLVHLPRAGMMTATAAAVAMFVAVLNLLPGRQIALAQAFPILSQQPRHLPEALDQILRTERLPASTTPADSELAYTFQAPTGTGYVVMDYRQKWLCLVVPGFGGGNGSVPCATTGWLLTETRWGLRVTAKHRGSDDIVELLPKGSTATLISTRGTRSVALHDGILTIVTRRRVSITTTVRGRAHTASYDMTGETHLEH